MIDIAIKELLDFSSDTYETLLYQMPEKQRALFVAIASAGKAKAINEVNLYGNIIFHQPVL